MLRLCKALHGPSHAPRAWYAKLDASLASLGFVRSPLEYAVYRRGDTKSYLLVGVYIDALVIIGTDATDIAEFKKQIKVLFKMSDLGTLSYYLGIKVRQERA